VPNRYAGVPPSIHAGGFMPSRIETVERSYGFCGAKKGPTPAASIKNKTPNAEQTANGDFRKCLNAFECNKEALPM